MGFVDASYRNFRNLKDEKISLDAREVFLIGENGQGKTNFIESIYALCFGSSFRTRSTALLIKNGNREGQLQGSYDHDGSHISEIAVTLQRRGKKKITVNGKAIKDRKELLENFPCVVFSHEDMEIINGPPERRRRFFNQTLSLYNPLFIDILRRYGHTLRNRNILLRDHNRQVLTAYDESLAEVGLQIQARRESVSEEFNRTFSPLFRSISGIDAEIRIDYKPSWPRGSTRADVTTLLRETRERDIRLETTSSGPHRDQFEIIWQDKSFTAFASTGQVRLGSLVLKVAQANFFHYKSGRKPVILLDDVLLELDSGRRERFLQALPAYEQALFAFLPDEQYLRYARDKTLMYTVREGGLLPSQA
jgi:DNA replication and repair protein RecF